MNQSQISKEQAYLAMFAFLEEYYNSTQSDAIGALLGSMSLLPDGTPADPAIKSDWDKAVNKALNSQIDASLRFK